MPGFGLLPTPAFPPMAQSVIPPAPPVQQPFQASFQAQSEPLTQKAHQVKLHSQIVGYLGCLDLNADFLPIGLLSSFFNMNEDYNLGHILTLSVPCFI